MKQRAHTKNTHIFDGDISDLFFSPLVPIPLIVQFTSKYAQHYISGPRDPFDMIQNVYYCSARSGQHVDVKY